MTKFKEPQYPAIYVDNQKNLRQFDRDMVTVLGGSASNLKTILDRGISFADNVDCVFITYTSNGVVATEDVVPHTLGKIPTGYIVITKDTPGIIYTTNPFTKTDLYLAWDTGSVTSTLLVF